jgi:methyl-accepting chemotaxis protein
MLIPNIFRHMSIGYKILLSILFPLLAMAGFASLQVMDRHRAVSDMDRLLGLADLAVVAGDLVHELQRERGSTALYLGAEGQRFSAELEQQRRRTDHNLEPFRLHSEQLEAGEVAGVGSLLQALSQDLASLEAWRSQVDTMASSVNEVAQYYTGLNTQLIDVIGRLSHVTDEADTTRTLAAYYSLLRAKELAGIERAVLAGAFGMDRIDTGNYQRFVSLIGAQQAQLNTFHALATNAQRELLQSQLAAPELDRLEAFRLAVLQSASRSGFGVDPAEWFAQQSGKIDRLKVVEDGIAVSIRESVVTLRAEAQAGLIHNIAITLSVAGLALLVAVLVGRNVVLRLRQTAQAMREIAEGDGDLTRRLDETHGDEIGALAKQFNAFAARMQSLLLDIKQSARRVYINAEELARGSEALAARTEQEASSLQETSASMEQITATVNQSAESAQQADALALSTAEVARRGEVAMEEVGGTMKDISASADRIGEIIALIDSIAFQTNILALNASVEAARAGEHGRGFAVVAQEVRTLASRSGDAAQEIRQLIDASVVHTRRGAEIVQRAGETMETIVQSVVQVSGVIAEISAGAHQQSAGIVQVNQAVSELDGNTQRNVAMVEQTSITASDMREQAEHLNTLMSAFILGQRDGPEPEAEAPSSQSWPSNMPLLKPA